MTREARTGRFTPYELVFEGGALADQRFASVAREAERRMISEARRDEFARLDAVAALIAQLVPDDADAAALDRSLDFIFHCYHFWRAGCPLYAVSEAAVRDLIEAPPDITGWRPNPSPSEVYLELPRSLFWAAAGGDEPPEPAEGMFVRMGDTIDCLVILGMRAGRPGFSVAAAGAGASPSERHSLEGPDSFQSEIPGAELAGLYSLGNASEAPLLALRLLWYLETYPESAEIYRAEDAGGGEAVVGGVTGLKQVVRLRGVERSRG